MTFVLHRGERADLLADALAGVLAAPLADPFQPEVVAVHSRGVERWLSHRLSAVLGTSPGREDGVAANLAFPFPGSLVRTCLQAATGLRPEDDRWAPERLLWPVLETLEANLAQPWLAVVATHVLAGGAEVRDRRFGVARHLAELFDRYAVHRPAMLQAWVERRDEDGEGAPLPDDARWQARLWREVRDRVGTESPAERLVRACDVLAASPGQVDLPDRLSLFGITRLPASYVDVLVALAAHRDVHLLTLQPSLAALVRAEPHHPLVRSWGRDAHELGGVLEARLAPVPTRRVEHPVEPVGTSALARLQAALRADEPPSAPQVLAAGDRSIQVHACHGPYRQAEVVRAAVTHLLAADPTLEPRDVVVLCPDVDELAPALHAAFASDDAGLPAIPYRLTDRSLRQSNPLLGAMAELLALVDRRITASEVLGFADLSPVRRRFGLDDDALDTFQRWVLATGTRWGLDAEHRATWRLGAVAAGTWAEGLRRLLLGVAMGEDGLRLVGGVLPLGQVEAGDIDLAGRLAELVDRLGVAVRSLCGPHDLAGWIAALAAAAEALLATAPGDAWQAAQLQDVLAATASEAGPSERGTPLHLTEVRDLLEDRLRGRPSRAAFRTGDLTMCTLVPMRSVPHRVVCIVGLDDGAFPRGHARDGDDLLVRARHPGDHDRRAEDCQLLLDAVLAAGDALVVTYAGHDSRTNEELPPAVPVSELLDALDATFVAEGGGAARDAVVTRHPLRSADPRCFTPGALGVSGAWSFDHLLVAAAATPPVPAGTARPLLDAPLPPVREDVVLLDDLLAFLSHPVRAFLRQRLGLSLGSFDDRPADALPVELSALEAYGIADRILRARLDGIGLEVAVDAERARGLLPPGALGAKVLATQADKAEQLYAKAAGGPGVVGRSSVDVDVELGDGRRLVGTVPDLVGETLSAVQAGGLRGRHRLHAYARFLAVAAAHPALDLRSVTIGWGRQKPARIDLGLGFATDAERRRRRAVPRLDLLVDLLDRARREPLPLGCETAYRWMCGERSEGDGLDEGRLAWQTAFRAKMPGEQDDPEHVLAFGGRLSFAELLAWDIPHDDEAGPRWHHGAPTRFERLAHRLWNPVFDLLPG